MTEGPHLPEVRKGWLAATGEVLNRALGMGVFEALGAMACFGAFAVTKNPHFLEIGIGLSALAAGWATHYAMKRTALKGWLAALLKTSSALRIELTRLVFFTGLWAHSI